MTKSRPLLPRSAAFLPLVVLSALAAAVISCGAMASSAISNTPTPAARGPRTIVAPDLEQVVRALVDSAVNEGAFPGAYVAVGTTDRLLVSYGAGRLDSTMAARPDSTTVWDIASLTKVIGTTTAIAQLSQDGRVALDAPVVRYLPEWRAAGAERVTVRQLLTHSSGLRAGRPLYREAQTVDEASRLLLATGPDTLPDARYEYSDLGFMLLGRVVERVAGEPLADFVSRRIFAPLDMRDTRYLPPASWRDRTAPTEQDPWRGRKVHGEVHDENAVRLGGVSGHAGLFSSGRDLSRFARMYLRGGTAVDSGETRRVLDSATVRQFTAVHDRLRSQRALGWEVPDGTNSAGRQLSPRAFGHTGFTGTSLWIDPERGVYVLLLTNRVNPTRNNRKIVAVRRLLADAVGSRVRRSLQGE